MDKMSKVVYEVNPSQLAQDLICKERRRNLAQAVKIITAHGHHCKHIQRMRIFVDELTCKKCEQQEETGEHIQFDCEVLGHAKLTVYGLVSKDVGILENIMKANGSSLPAVLSGVCDYLKMKVLSWKYLKKVGKGQLSSLSFADYLKSVEYIMPRMFSSL